MSASRSMTSFALEAAAWEIACWSSLYVRTSVGAAVGLGLGRLVGAGEAVGAGVVGVAVGTGVGVGTGTAVGFALIVGTGVVVGGTDVGGADVGHGVGQSLPAPRVPSSSTHITSAESYGALPLTVPPNDQLISLSYEPLVKLSV